MLKTLGFIMAAALFSFFLTEEKAFAHRIKNMSKSAGSISGNMNPVGGSNVSGSFRLGSLNSQTRVVVNLNGGNMNTTSPGHIHMGTCSNPGDILIPLNSIAFNSTGRGSSVITVNATLDSLRVGRSIMFHDTSGKAITCGDIPPTRAVGGVPPRVSVNCPTIQKMRVGRVRIMDRVQRSQAQTLPGGRGY